MSMCFPKARWPAGLRPTRRRLGSQTTPESVVRAARYDLPMMLAGADRFVAVIEPEAGVYSVPSKVLTYLAIGRPILASVPAENLAARLIRDHQAGYISPPGQEATLLEEARKLSGDVARRELLGENGRAYACKAFDIDAIGDRFSGILSDLIAD